MIERIYTVSPSKDYLSGKTTCQYTWQHLHTGIMEWWSNLSGPKFIQQNARKMAKKRMESGINIEKNISGTQMVSFGSLPSSWWGRAAYYLGACHGLIYLPSSTFTHLEDARTGAWLKPDPRIFHTHGIMAVFCGHCHFFPSTTEIGKKRKITEKIFW